MDYCKNSSYSIQSERNDVTIGANQVAFGREWSNRETLNVAFEKSKAQASNCKDFVVIWFMCINIGRWVIKKSFLPIMAVILRQITDFVLVFSNKKVSSVDTYTPVTFFCTPSRMLTLREVSLHWLLLCIVQKNGNKRAH